MIIPSIISKNFEEVKQKVSQIDGLVDWAQLDIMDGNFVLPTTWNAPEDLVNLEGRVKLEAHLMVCDPEEMLKEWMGYVDRVLVHVESTSHLPEILEGFDGTPSQFGVVLKMDTPLSILEDFRGKVNQVQLMSIDVLGNYGAKFDEAIYERIKQVRADFPELKISIDGGVTLENAPRLLAAGAADLVVGSAIWTSPDPAATIKQFQAFP